MKNKVTTILFVTSLGAFAATNVTVRNFSSGTSGFPLVDNTGAVLPIGELSWEVGTFATDFASSIGRLDPFADDAAVIGAFTPAGSAGAFNFDGLFSRSVSVDEGGALGEASTPLFVLVTHSPAGGDRQAMVFDFGISFPEQQGGNASVPTQSVSPDVVLFGGKTPIPVTDSGNIPGAFNFESGLTFDPIPEPSTSLLAALAGLGLVARRRR